MWIRRLGTFVGQVFGKGLITDSCYDTAQYGDRLLAAGNGSAGGSNAYAGITGVGDMNDPASFVGFDFDTIWKIDESSEYPFLRALELSPYEQWLEVSGIPSGTDPEELDNGIPIQKAYGACDYDSC